MSFWTFYRFKTLWLFSRSDWTTMILPETAFGVFSALSGITLTTNPNPRFLDVFSRLPQVILWIWLTTLAFNIANQRLSNSVLEDSINKPWRPMPSRRLTDTEARRLLIATIFTGLVCGLYFGVHEQTLGILILTWVYNDLQGGDENHILRDLINALALMCFSTGATIVACGHPQYSLNTTAYQWIAMKGMILFSSMHIQDMRDQQGDRAKGRSTRPLIVGDSIARWTIAGPVMFWSFACPWFWRVNGGWFMVPVTFGALTSFRILKFRAVESDNLTYKIWNIWMSSIYLLPLYSGLRR